jgi:hypothetical protein
MTLHAFSAFAVLMLAGIPAADPSLDSLLACHDRAVGGPALRSIARVEYHLSIEEAGLSLQGRYRAMREGSSGRMRIDVFADSMRVFSEWWDGRRAWQLPQNAAWPVEARSEGAQALRRGLEQPNHFWTLADMRRNGHTVSFDGTRSADGRMYHVVKLTLADGFANWYWLNPSTCRIERSRTFQAFHPDQDSTRKWLETVYDDFRTVAAVTRPFRERTIDLTTGGVIATTRIVTLRFDPPFDPDAVSTQ